jgi:hypothetical protein
LSLYLDCSFGLRPLFCVPGVVIVSGLSLRSSSIVLCARRCHCIWIVPSVFVQCFVCQALSLYLDCPFGLRPVFCVPSVVTVSGLSLRSSSSVLCARRCHCIWIVPSVFPSVYSMYCLADKWCQWHENDTFHIKCYDCIYDREMTCNMISLSTKHKNNL